MYRKKKWLIGIGIVLVGAATAGANFYFKRDSSTSVTVEALKKRDLTQLVTASGKIQAKRFVNISAVQMGRVTKLAVEEGDRVQPQLTDFGIGVLTNPALLARHGITESGFTQSLAHPSDSSQTGTRRGGLAPRAAAKAGTHSDIGGGSSSTTL